MKKIILLLILVSLGILIYFVINTNKNVESISSIKVSEALSGSDTVGFERAFEPRTFIFPDDFYHHTTFKTEWWYFTGNLSDNNGRDFGFQFTIFRNSMIADSMFLKTNFAAKDIYMIHIGLSDIKSKQFYSFERFSRASAGLAGASAENSTVWLENQKIKINSDKDNHSFEVTASDANIKMILNFISKKKPVLQGNNGLSQKSSQPGNASYYFSLTRLETIGKIIIERDTFDVSGWSWMDREWSTSAIAEYQVGWDWFSLQFDNNTELMYYQIRKKDGTADSISKGTFVSENGESFHLSYQDVVLEVADYWKSSSNIEYPIAWKMKVPKYNIDIEIKPFFNQQEHILSVRYWEGAVKITGKINNRQIVGKGYVELTGYDE